MVANVGQSMWGSREEGWGRAHSLQPRNGTCCLSAPARERWVYVLRLKSLYLSSRLP